MVAKLENVSDTAHGRIIRSPWRRARGVSDVEHIALGGIWPHKRLACPGENLGGIVIVEKNRSDGIFPHWPDAMRQEQPAFVEFDG